MWICSFRCAIVATLTAAFFSGCHSQDYSHLEGLGISCPSKDRCAFYRNNLSYMDRNCECDNKCTAYKDCCIDALPSPAMQSSRPAVRTDIKCLNYGESNHTGVYVISKCSNSWNGPRAIRSKCTGSVDFSDPLVAAPATDVAQKKTYRNLACAKCNNANMASLKNFQVKVACDRLQELTEQQIMADITYNQQLRSWGVNRLNNFGNGTEFVDCDIIFDVPAYLNNSVRFCRSNLISICASGWSRPAVARLCTQYMAVVYSNGYAYKNPDCAICNHKTVNELSCERNSTLSVFGRKRPMSFALLLDVNQSDGDQVGMRPVATPQCPSGNKYDPFFKKCRPLTCALPGHNFVNGRCVKG